MIEDWKREIIVLCLVKQRLAEVNAGQRPSWPFHYPANPATAEELIAAENCLGFGLDPLYRTFLSHANGWSGFFQYNDLFGTADILQGVRHRKAQDSLNSLESSEELDGVEIDELLPIAVSEFDIDVFAMARPSSQAPGKVFWLAGGLVEMYPNFAEFFLAMVDYNRREIQRFEGTLHPES